MDKKMIWGLLWLFLLAGCATFESAEVREQRYGKAAPAIDQYFASPTMRPGDTWKVYLKASDPDGDMKRIVTYLGPGSRGADASAAFTRLREEDRREFSGYLYWFPGPDVGYSGQYVMIIQVEDRADHDLRQARCDWSGRRGVIKPSAPSSRLACSSSSPGIVHKGDTRRIYLRAFGPDGEQRKFWG